MARIYDRFMRQRLSRRRLLAATGGTALGAAALAACGDGGGDGARRDTAGTAGPAEGTPVPGGILKQRQENPYPNFNPFGPGIAALAQGLFLGFTVFDHLWYVPTDTGETVPFLAKEIEVIDAQTVRVTFRDAVFHNKPPVDGRDVRSTDLKASMARFKEQIPLGFSWLQEIFERLDTPDNRTAVYHQNRPWAWFFTSSNAGSPWTSSILPEETVDMDDLLNDDAIGSGRWVLAGDDAGANVKLRKFENWREPGLPFLDGIDFVSITEDTLAQASFAARDIDSIGGLSSREQRDLLNRFGDQITPSSDLSRAYRTLMVKFEEPFLDPKVRQAINLALNRQEIIDLLDDGDGEATGPLPPAHKVFALGEDDPDLQEYFRHDPQEARQLLEAASFPFDQEFDLKWWSNETNSDLVQIIARQLKAVGIKVNVPGGEDLVAWLANTLGPGNFQMTAFTHLPYEDPSLPLSFYREPNFMGYTNDEVEAAFQAAAQELDEERRIDLTKEAQRVIIRNWGPMFNLHSPVSFGARWSYYKGVVEGRGSFGLFNSRAWLDK